MRVELLDQGTESLWRQFVAGTQTALFYASLEYRDLLSRVLGASAHYLMAMDGERVCGVLPCFSMRHEHLGVVLNSLPYYGSNGGCLTDGRAEVVSSLINGYQSLEKEIGCAASTLVCSPFDAHAELYPALLGDHLQDSRIGQITLLPEDAEASDERLFSLYDETARRNVKKARKAGIRWRVDDTASAMAFLHKTHDENIRSIGGLPKEWKFFDCVNQTVPNRYRRLYIAELDGTPLAALLTFRFNRTVEYYTPAVVAEHRSLQALPLLVHEAMREAMRDGFLYWNWGGTWSSQIGVYRFKRKWGAIDHPYRYYTRLFDRRLLQYDRVELGAAFRGFYVLPFDQLSRTAPEPEVL